MNYNEVFPKVVSHAKEYGFVFQSSEIYEDGLSAVYDYGPNGVLLKKNLSGHWWRAMTQWREDVVGLDAAILMHPRVWKASGHVDAFMDPLVDNKDSKKRYRADHLIEDGIEKIAQKINKEVEKAAKKFGESFDAQLYRTTNARIIEYQKQIDGFTQRFVQAQNDNNLEELKQIIVDLEVVCPVSGTRNWTDVRQFNLMFGTQMSSDESSMLWLRPETAQGIFVNYLNVQKTCRMKIPFGIAQIGKAFRNEIVARQFIFRMREFEQMEMQFFIKPGTQKDFFESWLQARKNWHLSLGINPEMIREKPHDKLAHYADAATDLEFHFPFGFKEMEGIHSRTDYDLKRHAEFSGKKITYFDPELQESYVPFVIETSVGLDRLFLAHLCSAYCEEEAPTADGKTDVRTVLKLNPLMAPTKIAVLPLVKKDGLDELGLKIAKKLMLNFDVDYEDKDTVGKRYRRQDAKGTPYCITIDNETVENQTVTIRSRDTMIQEKISLDAIQNYFFDKLNPAQLAPEL